MSDFLSAALGGLGSGLKAILSWLFSGLISIVTKAIRALDGIFDVLDSLWDFFVSIKDAAIGLMSAFFPWIPAQVMTVISLGFLAVLLAGIVKKVRGK